MNRIIKFRVWNGIEWCGNIKPNQIVNPNDYDNSENLIFQQFTGLLDKNGREIYEGDILKISYYDDWMDEELKYYNAAVYFNEKTGSFVSSIPTSWEKGYCGCPIHLHESVEVISNIFENSDLL